LRGFWRQKHIDVLHFILWVKNNEPSWKFSPIFVYVSMCREREREPARARARETIEGNVPLAAAEEIKFNIP
jgi:hypothetical protein